MKLSKMIIRHILTIVIFGDLQAAQIIRLLQTLVERLVCRSRGVRKGGRDVGASNRSLNASMEQMRLIGDPRALRDLKHESSLALVETAAESLVARKLIPHSAKVSRTDILAAWRFLSRHPDADSKDLYKLLAKEAENDEQLAPYLALVTRAWLIGPVESVVESMASVLGDVYGTHRQLEHDSGEDELIIRWNGPELSQASSLLEFLQQREHFKFKRRGNPKVWESLPGKVMRRLARRVCARAPVFCS